MASKRLAKRAPPRKRRPRIVKKTIDALDRLLDQVIEDPDRFIDRVERTAEGAVRGVDRIIEEYERDPQKARKEFRTFVVRGLAKLGKKRLNGSR